MPDLKSLIRTIPDYPKEDIMFRDVTTLLGDVAREQTCHEQRDHHREQRPALARPAGHPTERARECGGKRGDR